MHTITVKSMIFVSDVITCTLTSLVIYLTDHVHILPNNKAFTKETYIQNNISKYHLKIASQNNILSPALLSE